MQKGKTGADEMGDACSGARGAKAREERQGVHTQGVDSSREFCVKGPQVKGRRETGDGEVEDADNGTGRGHDGHSKRAKAGSN